MRSIEVTRGPKRLLQKTSNNDATQRISVTSMPRNAGQKATQGIHTRSRTIDTDVVMTDSMMNSRNNSNLPKVLTIDMSNDDYQTRTHMKVNNARYGGYMQA